MFNKLHPASSLLGSDLASFQRQESIFIVLNLVLLSVLVLLHRLFASFWGSPSQTLLVAAASLFILGVLELVWVRGLSKPLRPNALTILTWASIGVNLGVAVLLSNLTNHEDSPYFVLIVVPILEAAFRFELITVLGVVSVADLSLFYGVWLYFKHHPPLDVGEYFEAGTTSLMFVMVGTVAWLLVRGIRQRETSLAKNVLELHRTRERLIQEERLAAMGRLSSAIAHEIRNPVAMIASSLATAEKLSGKERDEMFKIASEEASRLVRLTSEFLSYARPRPPQPRLTSLSETLDCVKDACRAYVSQKGVQIQTNVSGALAVDVDPGQLHQALMNLIMNAADGSARDAIILVNAYSANEHLCIDVLNSGSPIPLPDLSRIFEPFFTTKPQGTGLGLAIARNLARAHGGDLVLSANGPRQICFSLILPMTEALPAGATS